MVDGRTGILNALLYGDLSWNLYIRVFI